ncbi:AP-1 complex-associated regulatory protein isoform X2 [Syngnathus scovelli]|uniref:AP-1 complex-associated regulatory protein isoform X2 n=1 Tax=Syngnathus scovelli TaxID=161590 RepID=UPI0021108E26|nr:AP-1 complex-associated regulatory protein isoform X2 [Syngnathus scovelli]
MILAVLSPRKPRKKKDEEVLRLHLAVSHRGCKSCLGAKYTRSNDILVIFENAMGNCWAFCVGLFRREANRIQRGGGSKYFRSSTTGEHYTIEFENLVESDEEESPQPCPRPISEDELTNLREHRYADISKKQVLIDQKLQAERLAKKTRGKADGCGSDPQTRKQTGDGFDPSLQNVKAQSEAFRSNRLPSDTNVVTPNTECSWDFTTKTRSTNDDATSLDLEWEDEEGINRALPAWERSRTEEDILRAALRPGGKQAHSGPTSASEDSNALEWENDFVSTHPEDNADPEFEGFVNPVMDTPSEEASDYSLGLDGQDR